MEKHFKVDEMSYRGMTLVESPDEIKYDYMAGEVEGTSSIISTETTIDVADITVGDPLRWSVLLAVSEKRICSSFDECLVPFMSVSSPR